MTRRRFHKECPAGFLSGKASNTNCACHSHCDRHAFNSLPHTSRNLGATRCATIFLTVRRHGRRDQWRQNWAGPFQHLVGDAARGEKSFVAIAVTSLAHAICKGTVLPNIPPHIVKLCRFDKMAGSGAVSKGAYLVPLCPAPFMAVFYCKT